MRVAFAILIVIFFKVRIQPIDGVICQMHVNILEIFRSWCLVRSGSKPRHAFIKQVHFHRVNAVK